MKQNSKKILVWLYSAETRWVEKDQFNWLLSDISQAGVRSLLFLMEKNNLILSELINNKRAYMITSYGKEALKQEIPALNKKVEESSSWSILLFLNSPKNDLNFRNFRQKLLECKAISLSRGIYIYPGILPKKIREECRIGYSNNVAILKNAEFSFGDERLIMGQKIGLSDLFSLLSGVSKEVDQLTARYRKINKLDDQLKITVSSIFHRLFEIINNDSGLLGYYFPQVESCLQLLTRLQKMT